MVSDVFRSAGLNLCLETQIQRNLFFMKEFLEKLRKQAAINLDIKD